MRKRFAAAVTFEGLTVISVIIEYKKNALHKYSLYNSDKYNVYVRLI